MGTPNFTHLLVPVANPDDAERRCDALEQYLGPEVERITIVHVIERTEGYLDSASPEALEQEADQLFSYVEDHLEDGPEPDCELRYGTDTVEEIVVTADELDVSMIGFTPRPNDRLHQLLSENTSYRLITESHHPVVAFSNGAESRMSVRGPPVLDRGSQSRDPAITDGLPVLTVYGK
jgi:nucleotide-binding universal stress UspA family protein